MAVKYNREQIATDLLLCSTNLEVCKKNNISETTLYRLKKDKEFQKVLTEQKEKIFNKTMIKAQAYSLEALDILMEIARDGDAPQSSRVSACNRVLELGQTAFDQDVILKKLEEVEKRINETKENEL